MKTIYIDENILKNKHLKESILLDTLPNDVVDKITNHKTSLGNNPSIPDIFNTPYLLKIAEQGFEKTKNKLKEIGEINDTDETELEAVLSHLILKCKKLETPYRSELERICFNYVIDLFEIPEDTVDIKVTLSDEIDLNKDSIILDPNTNDDNMEFNTIDDALTIKGEVYKRRLLDSLCMGGAMTFSNDFDSFSNEINKINPDLIDLYNKIIALNNYLLYTKSDFNLTDENKMQLGTVEVSLGNDITKVKIEAQGVIMPILLSELIRGFMELFISHGLPKDKNIAMNVLGKSDFLKTEPWDMKFGPLLWEKFTSTFNDIDTNELPYLLMRVSKIDVDKFNVLFKEIFANTKKGKNIMSHICSKVKNDMEYDKFVDKMDKTKNNKGIISDEYIHPDDL